MGSDFSGRLKVAANRVGGQIELAKKSGVPKGTLANYAQGGSEPNVQRLVALAEAAEVSVEWLASGRGPLEAGVDDVPTFDSSLDSLPAEFTLIPHLDIKVSTGGGSVVDNDEAEMNRLAFVRKHLTKRGIRPEAARLVTARGDSMEPTISDGDALLVDTSVHEIRADSIYCIQVGENLRAKRLQRDMRGGVWVISDNPQYADEHLSAADAADLQIAGRVVWIGRDV